jgi:hypothetical protein
MKKMRAVAGMGVAGALILTAGCGKAAEKIGEKAAEKAVENAAGGGNLDITDDGFTFESEDGTVSYQVDDDGNVIMKGPDGEVITADSDGNMTMTGEDGETTFSSGEGAEVPDGWPDFLALPDGAKITSSATSNEGGQKVGSVTAEVTDGDVEEIYETYKEAIEAEGFEVSDSFTSSSSGDVGAVSGNKGDVSPT